MGRRTYEGGEAAVAVADTAVPLASSPTYTNAVLVTAGKAGGDNAGTVYVGPADVHRTAHRYRPLEPGDSMEIAAPRGQVLNLQDIYVNGLNVADGVRFQYSPAA
jgi:hypothetical protein